MALFYNGRGLMTLFDSLAYVRFQHCLLWGVWTCVRDLASGTTLGWPGFGTFSFSRGVWGDSSPMYLFLLEFCRTTFLASSVPQMNIACGNVGWTVMMIWSVVSYLYHFSPPPLISLGHSCCRAYQSLMNMRWCVLPGIVNWTLPRSWLFFAEYSLLT